MHARARALRNKEDVPERTLACVLIIIIIIATIFVDQLYDSSSLELFVRVLQDKTNTEYTWHTDVSLFLYSLELFCNVLTGAIKHDQITTGIFEEKNK